MNNSVCQILAKRSLQLIHIAGLLFRHGNVVSPVASCKSDNIWSTDKLKNCPSRKWFSTLVSHALTMSSHPADGPTYRCVQESKSQKFKNGVKLQLHVTIFNPSNHWHIYRKSIFLDHSRINFENREIMKVDTISSLCEFLRVQLLRAYVFSFVIYPEITSFVCLLLEIQ